MKTMNKAIKYYLILRIACNIKVKSVSKKDYKMEIIYQIKFKNFDFIRIFNSKWFKSQIFNFDYLYCLFIMFMLKGFERG